MPRRRCEACGGTHGCLVRYDLFGGGERTLHPTCAVRLKRADDPVPLYLPFELFERLRDRADREGTAPQFLAATIIERALADVPPAPTPYS